MNAVIKVHIFYIYFILNNGAQMNEIKKTPNFLTPEKKENLAIHHPI